MTSPQRLSSNTNCPIKSRESVVIPVWMNRQFMVFDPTNGITCLLTQTQCSSDLREFLTRTSRNQEGDNLAHTVLAQKAGISWVRPYLLSQKRGGRLCAISSIPTGSAGVKKWQASRHTRESGCPIVTAWIPACAGMTDHTPRHTRESGCPVVTAWIPAFAGMTGNRDDIQRSRPGFPLSRE